MATALQKDPAEAQASGSPRRDAYRCECGHALHVYGGGRHRVYFELEDTSFTDPVMNRVCPECGRGLPGKGGP